MDRAIPSAHDVVFNVVWTGRVFDALAPFVASQMAHSRARYRFLANACPADQLEAMERFSVDHPGRVVEVLEVAAERMIRHGEALDRVLAERDDGPLFSLIDPDIIARGPFLGRFVDALADLDAVTAGREVWSETNVRPSAHPGVNGEHFFDQDGFTFGSPHLAIYRRAALTDTVERWGVGFGVAGNDIAPAVRTRLAALRRDYWMYDTGKIVNILLQGDGHLLRHLEHPDLVHIGGVSHFLAPPSSAPAARDQPPAWGEGDDWGGAPGMAGRYAVARYAAAVARDVADGGPAPPLPADGDPALADKLDQVRNAVCEVVGAHGCGPATGRGPGSVR